MYIIIGKVLEPTALIPYTPGSQHHSLNLVDRLVSPKRCKKYQKILEIIFQRIPDQKQHQLAKW